MRRQLAKFASAKALRMAKTAKAESERLLEAQRSATAAAEAAAAAAAQAAGEAVARPYGMPPAPDARASGFAHPPPSPAPPSSPSPPLPPPPSTLESFAQTFLMGAVQATNPNVQMMAMSLFAQTMQVPRPAYPPPPHGYTLAAPYPPPGSHQSL